MIVPFILLFSFLLSTLLFSLWFGFLKTVGFCATRGVDCPLDTAHGRRAYCRETKFGVYGLGWLIRLFLVATTARYCKRYRLQSQTTSSRHFTQFAIEIMRSIVPPSQVRETQLLCNIHCAGLIISIPQIFILVLICYHSTSLANQLSAFIPIAFKAAHNEKCCKTRPLCAH